MLTLTQALNSEFFRCSKGVPEVQLVAPKVDRTREDYFSSSDNSF